MIGLRGTRGLLGVAISFGALLGAPGAALATSPFLWSAPTMPDRVVSGNDYINLHDVSCSSSSSCLAVDAAGNVYRSTDPTNNTGSGGATGSGATWTPQTIDAGHGLNGVSCVPSGTLCVAVASGGGMAVSNDSGQSWRVRAIDGAGLDGVSCPTAALCVAVDQNGNVLASTDAVDDAPGGTGATWSLASVDPGTPLRAVSCTTDGGTLCVAVDDSGAVVSSTEPAGGASKWVLNDIATGSLTTVSCPTTTLCVVGDNNGNAYASTDPSDGGGAAWSMSKVSSGAGLYGLYCTTSRCLVSAGQTPYLTTTPASGGWTQFGGPAGNFTCEPGGSFCLSANQHGAISAATDAEVDSSNWGQQVVAWANYVGGLSCFQTSLCAAIDDGGNIVTSSDPADAASATWSGHHILGEGGFGPQLNAISCPSSTLCVAVDGAGNAVTTADGGSTWSSAQIDPATSHTNGHPPGLQSVSCPSTTLCVVVDDWGQVLTTTDPADGAPGASGATWSTPAVVDGTNTLGSVSCTSALCLISDRNGHMLASATPTNGASWTTTKLTGVNSIYTVSCFTDSSMPSDTTCAADTGSQVFISTNPTAATPTWTASYTAPTAGTLFGGGVVCASTSLCLLGNSAGQVVATTNATTDSGSGPGSGATWTTASIGPAFDGENLSAACMSSTQCLVAGRGSRDYGSFAAVGTTGGSNPPTHVLSVSLAGSGTGRVSDGASISCPGTSCSHSYSEGAEVTLTENPTNGSTFHGWGGACSGTGPTCQVTVANDTSLTATFDPAPPPGPQSGNAPLFWFSQGYLDRVSPLGDSTSIDSLSCPSATLCAGVDGSGNIVTTTSPNTPAPWAEVGPDPNANAVSDISCPATNLCVAVDSNGNAVTSIDPGDGPGALWTLKGASPGESLFAISCPSTSFCAAVDNNGGVVTSTDPADGASAKWAVHDKLNPRGSFYDISCSSSALCVAIDGSGYAWISTNPGASSPTWTNQQVDGSGRGLSYVTCTLAGDLCLAYDDNGSLHWTANPSAGAGAKWSIESSPDTHSLNDLTCASRSLCVGVDSWGDIVTSTTPIKDGSWTKNTSVDSALSDLYAVSCPSGSLCLVSGSGVGFSSKPSSGPWSTNLNADGVNDLQAIACASSSLCVAVDYNGGTISTTNPSAAGGPTWTGHSIDGTNKLLAVGCASEGLCVAVDSKGNAVTTSRGSTWDSPMSIDGTNQLDGVACPSASECLAVDGAGNVIRTTSASSGSPAGSGASWTVQNIDGALSLNGISCISVGVCVAVDSQGHALITKDADTTSGNPSWSRVAIDGHAKLNAISCVSSGFCAAGDELGYVVTTPDATQGASSKWAAAPADVTGSTFGGVTAISCASASFCAALDYTNNLVTNTTAGTPSTWFVNPIDANAHGLTGIACISAGRCLIVDNYGHAWVGSTTQAASGPILSLAAVGTGSGTFSGTNVPPCPGRCWGRYGPGTALTITATASPGSVFAGWSGACTGKGTCEVTLSSDQGVSATFNKLVTIVGNPTSTGSGVSAKLSCAAPAGKTCPTTETLKSSIGKVVGTKSAALAGGKTTTVVITLNSTGMALLKKTHKLVVMLTVALVAGGKLIPEGTASATVRSAAKAPDLRSKRMAAVRMRPRRVRRPWRRRTLRTR